MALTDKNILITPNIGSSSDDPKIEFTSATSTELNTATLSVDHISATKSQLTLAAADFLLNGNNLKLTGTGTNGRVDFNNTLASFDWLFYQNDDGKLIATVSGTGGAELQLTSDGADHTNAQLDVGGNRVLTTADEGTLDAGTLDSLNSTQFVRSDADDTMTGILTLTNSSDRQLILNGNGTTYAGIQFTDVDATDYLWYRGLTGTFAIGGGGSSIVGKKLHIDGGTTIGAASDGTTPPTDGLYIQGGLTIAGLGADAQTTALMINGSDQVSTRALGTNAFSSDDYVDFYDTYLAADASYLTGYENDTREFVISGDVNTTGSTNFPSQFGVTWGFRPISGANGSNWGRHFDLFKTSTSSVPLYVRGRNNSTGAPGAWQRIFMDDYHPNADQWTTSRTLTIGNTGKAVNGGANVSWSLAEIGALPLSGGSLSGNLEIATGSPVLEVNDTNATTQTNQIGYVSFQRQGTETAWVGLGSIGNDILTLRNTEGEVRLSPTGGIATVDGNEILTTANYNTTTDTRYYTQAQVDEFLDDSYVDNVTATNLAVGWYTIATVSSGRAGARFAIWDINSSDHQMVVFYAAHHYGTDASNTLTCLMNSYFAGNPFRYIRIKELGTYDGAAVQIYIDDGSNQVRAAIVGDNVQTPSWVLKDWIPDATDPGNVSTASNSTNGTTSAWASFTEASRLDLNQIAQGGISTTGPIYADGDTVQYRVIHEGANSVSPTLTGDNTLTFGPNSNPAANTLRIGGNNAGPAADRASIAISSGNLHVDCVEGGYGIYLNWYANTTNGTYFGDGAGSEKARFDGNGQLFLTGNQNNGTGHRITFQDDGSPGLSGGIGFTGSLGNGGGYNASLQSAGELQYSAAGHFFADTSVVNTGVPNAWHRMNGDFTWGTNSGSNVLTQMTFDTSAGDLTVAGDMYTSGYKVVTSPNGPTGDFNTQTVTTYVGALNANANTPFGNAWYNLVNVRHRGGESDGNQYGGQLAWGMTGFDGRLAFRRHNANTWGNWYEVYHTGNSGIFLRSDTDDTAAGQITFPTAIANRPVLGQGFISRGDQGDGDHDIHGLSERYYPSNATAADAWGLQWYGTGNQYRFKGAGSNKVIIDLNAETTTNSATGGILVSDSYRRISAGRGFLNGNYPDIENAGTTNTTGPIYCIGNSWYPGTTTLGNFYGVGYTYSSATFLPYDTARWGMYVAADGDARIWLQATNGNIFATGNITAYASDGRLKTNVKKIENALDKVCKIRGVEYDWVDNIETEYEFSPTAMHEVGVIAQEVQEVLPEVVTTAPFNGIYSQKTGWSKIQRQMEEELGREVTKEEAKNKFEELPIEEREAMQEDYNFLTVDYERITPLLIEAIKEQQELINNMQQRIDALEKDRKES